MLKAAEGGTATLMYRLVARETVDETFSGASNVTFPLLLTKTVENWSPRKLAVKPSGTKGVEPSSVRGNWLTVKPDNGRTAPTAKLPASAGPCR
jgi:hypothetical protein